MVAWAIKTIQISSTVSLLIVLAITGYCAPPVKGVENRTKLEKPTVVRLFNTIELRSDLKTLPQWLRVLSAVKEQMKEYEMCKNKNCSPAAKSWRKMIRLSKNKPFMEILKTVNGFINQWPYRLDSEAYGKSDYWASPNEFLKQSGDCEDYSITKYFALRQLGFKAENMRVVVVKDQIRNIGHAVLAVYNDDTAFILDNLSDLVLPHTRYQHYIPQYSVNGKNRWAHIRPIGKQGF